MLKTLWLLALVSPTLMALAVLAAVIVDFRLGISSLNGLELIRQHALQSHAYLVTTDFSEPDLQDACAAVGVRLIPKGALPSIALQFD